MKPHWLRRLAIPAVFVGVALGAYITRTHAATAPVPVTESEWVWTSPAECSTTNICVTIIVTTEPNVSRVIRIETKDAKDICVKQVGSVAIVRCGHAPFPHAQQAPVTPGGGAAQRVRPST